MIQYASTPETAVNTGYAKKQIPINLDSITEVFVPTFALQEKLMV